MTARNGRVIFCDGFAGPGRYSGGEEGSPLIALRTLHEHSYSRNIRAEVRFLFIERDSDRCGALRENVNAFVADTGMSYPVSVECRAFDDTLTEILDDMEQEGSKMAPTLCFVDPFGVKGVRLSSLARLMRNPSCELLITFMIGFLDRFLSTPEYEQHVDELFGTDEWRKAVGWGEEARSKYLRQLYQRQLAQSVGARYVRYFSMLNESNRPIYDLFFASTHPKGVDRMKEAMWRVDASGTYQFTDATSPDQQVLLGRSNIDIELVDLLFEQFDGSTQTWPAIEEALRQSPYIPWKRPIQRYAKDHPEELTIESEPGKKARTLSKRTRVRFHRRAS